jgi:hypothetical protein
LRSILTQGFAACEHFFQGWKRALVGFRLHQVTEIIPRCV